MTSRGGPSAITEPWGCESWVDQDGRRALPDELEPDPFLKNPDPDPEPFRPATPYRSDQVRGEGPAQAVLPMPDAGPLFAGCLEAKS